MRACVCSRPHIWECVFVDKQMVVYIGPTGTYSLPINTCRHRRRLLAPAFGHILPATYISARISRPDIVNLTTVVSCRPNLTRPSNVSLLSLLVLYTTILQVLGTRIPTVVSLVSGQATYYSRHISPYSRHCIRPGC